MFSRVGGAGPFEIIELGLCWLFWGGVAGGVCARSAAQPVRPQRTVRRLARLDEAAVAPHTEYALGAYGFPARGGRVPALCRLLGVAHYAGPERV